MSLLFSHPIKKLTLLAAFGGGYVLGAKAGRERYEQLKQTAQQVADDPRVQQATSQAQEFVRDTAEKVKDDPRLHDVAERVQSVAHLATDKAQEAADAVTDQGNQEDAKAKIQEVADATKDKVEDVAGTVKDDVDSALTDTQVHPLLADEHFESDDEVVYSSGPDVEESIDELADVDPTKNPAAEDKQGNA